MHAHLICCRLLCPLSHHVPPPPSPPPRSGKKYGKLLSAARLEGDLSRYAPFIVPSRNAPALLFCALTGELLNARLGEVKQHLKGRKFGRAKGERWG